MRFSVIIPTFNRKAVLRQCLQALQSQDYSNFEVLVIDGGSDGTAEMVNQEFPTYRYLRDPRSGPSAARNMGIEHATSEIVVFTDDDCVVPSDWLSKFADGYRRHPEVFGIAGRCVPPDTVWKHNVFARHEMWINQHIYGLGPDRAEFVGNGHEVPGATNNIAYRRAILQVVGGFSTQFRAHIAGEERELRDRLRDQGYDCYLYLPLTVLHLREYNERGFIIQMLEQALGVKRHLQRISQGTGSRLSHEKQRRPWQIPGLLPAWQARDWPLVTVLIAERIIYGIGRILPENANLQLITIISKW